MEFEANLTVKGELDMKKVDVEFYHGIEKLSWVENQGESLDKVKVESLHWEKKVGLGCKNRRWSQEGKKSLNR